MSDAASSDDLTLGDIEEQEMWEEHTRERIEQMAADRDAATCRICGIEMNQRTDCGGDCVWCLADAGDPECVEYAAKHPRPTNAAIVHLPEGYRWATGGGSPIGDCNGRHIAVDDGTPGTLCGRYGPASMRDPQPPRYPGDDAPCKVCLRSLAAREAKANV